MNFTDEQQAHVDGLIKKKYAEAHAKAEAKAAEQLTAAEAKHAGEVQTLKAENESLKAERGQQNERIRTALLKAEIAQTSAVNVSQVMKLIGDSVITGDDGELKVVDEKGLISLDEAGRPLSVKTYLEGFLKDNPHLARTAGLPGAGSMSSTSFHGAGAAKTMRRAEFNELDATRKKTFIKSDGQLKD